MRIWLIISIVGCCFAKLAAQCPTTDFSVKSAICQSENLLIANNSISATQYEWDFCSGDFQLNPQAVPILTNGLLSQAWSIRFAKDQNTWYGFAISVTLNRLIRFDFGTSLNNIPTLADLGNPSNLLNGATDFQLIQEGTSWFALVPNTNTSTLIRLNFGITLASTPTAVNLGNFCGVFSTPNGISIIQENGNTTAFVANEGVSQITRLNFGNSILNTPTTATLPLPGGVSLRGIAFTKECNRWYALVLSYGNGKVYSLDFNAGLQQPFISSELTFYTGYNFPATISINHEGGQYYAFIQSAIGSVYRLSFGASIIDGTGTGVDLGNLGVSNANFAQTWTHEGTDWFGFSIDRENGRLIRLTLPVTCTASTKYLSTENPLLVNYQSAGAKQITLKAINNTGDVSTASRNVTVSTSVSPDITFTSQNVCANNDVLFDGQNSSGGIAAYNWNFGDGNTSSLEDPVHQFSAAGDYQVQLEITGTNACKNLRVDTLSIFNEPVADFAIPTANPLCTNQQHLFDNTSVVDSGFPVTWQWTLNGTPTTTQEDFSYTFTNTSTQQIKLTASIPGCQSEITKNINTLVTGPLPDFTMLGQCEDANVTFTDATTGSVTGYTWDFGNGMNSSLANPIIAYADPGNYTVTLTVSNAAGCNNSISKPRRIYSKPVTNFTALAPPFSCNGTSTVFNDLTPPPTDSNITTRAWNFGDPGNPPNTSTQINPQHIYPTAGDYTVTLTVGTNFACQTTLQKTVTIHQTPAADFTHSSLCEDSPVNFSDASPGASQAWSWQIGSAFYATENPDHTFTNPGNYDVTLSVTAANNCIGSVTKQVVIAPKIPLDFSVSKNCRNQNTEFVNLTNDAADPITNVSWNFNNEGSASIDNPTFKFLSVGTVNVTLTTQVQSGCTYSLTKAIAITEGPLAAFTATPNSGEAPLDVQFSNNSLNANSYLWYFNDQPGNTQPAPEHTFDEHGVYTVRLVALDAANCSDTTKQIIEVLRPVVLDVPYPNPSTGEFTIKWQTEENVFATFLLVDAMGRTVQDFSVKSGEGVNTQTLDITGHPSGVYILRISYRNKVKSYRLIISQ